MPKVYYSVILGTLISSICSAQVPGREEYVQAYTAYVLRNSNIFARGMVKSGMSPEAAEIQSKILASKAIDCHIKYLDDYPEPLQKAMYETIQNGGSYAEAESALKIRVAEAHFAGDDLLVQQFGQVTESVIQCVGS
ncbi:hypothetical protein [Gynuella sunshinyii]|nr:hypothetical protein [Gynuella sunshinyii]